jgi:Predicted permease
LSWQKRADDIFGRFLVGKIIDSTIIAILTYIVLTVTKMPYSLLISFIVGVTNIIPFFGPFIGAIPSFFIILFVSPIKALWFLVIILIIQQLDGNVIGPKILGDTLGISAFWILFSLLISGEIFGFIGLVIGVPLFVFVYSIVKDNVEKRLQKQKDYL